MELNELIKALKSMLPEKVPYGDLIGAEGVYAHSGPLVYADPEPYFIEQAAAELKKLSEIQDILGPIYDTDHLPELIQADKDERVIIPPMAYGDTVYRITRCGNIPPVLDGTMYDGDGGPGTATGLYCPYGLSETCPFSCEEDGSFFCENHKDELAIFEDRVKEFALPKPGIIWFLNAVNAPAFAISVKPYLAPQKMPRPLWQKWRRATVKNRTTVHHGMLPDLKDYLVQSGWTLERPMGFYEVLRARHPGYPRPLLVHDRTSGGCGYSIDERDLKVYKGWLRNRRKRGLPNFATAEEWDRYWEKGD